MRKRVCFFVAIALLSGVLNAAGAAEIMVNVDYSANTVTVNGTVGALYAGRYVSLRVLNPGMSVNELKSGFDGALNWIEQSRVDTEGNYMFSVRLTPVENAGHTYTAAVFVDKAQAPLTATFDLYPQSYINAINGKIKAAVSGNDSDKITELIDEYHSVFRLNENSSYADYLTLDPQNTVRVALGILKEKPENTSAFKTAFEGCVSARLLSEASVNAPAYQTKLLALLHDASASVITRFGEYGGPEKSGVIQAIMEGDFNCKTDLREAFESLIVLKEVNASVLWTELITAFLRYNDVLGIDFTGYNRLNNQAAAITELLKSKPFRAIAAIPAKFAQAADKQKQAAADNSTTTGSTGGSSHGGIGTIAPIAPAPVPAAPSRTEFPDMAGCEWAVESVTRLADAGVVSGYSDGSFIPHKSITRAEFVKMLVSAFSLDAAAGAAVPFGDVAPDAWYAGVVAAAFANGLITGDDSGNFNSDAPITREDAAVMLDRLQGGAGQPGVTDFEDAGHISGYAEASVMRLFGDGIIHGYEDNTFRPAHPVTRAESAVLIDRLMSKQ